MPLFEWTPEFSVNIRKVDEQHKKLIALINELHDARVAGHGRDEIVPVLQGLADYAREHFGMEEDLMAMHGYPKYLSHKAAHYGFAHKVMEFRQQYEEGSITISMDILDFMKDWLSYHILHTDMEYAPYLNERGVF